MGTFSQLRFFFPWWPWLISTWQRQTKINQHSMYICNINELFIKTPFLFPWSQHLVGIEQVSFTRHLFPTLSSELIIFSSDPNWKQSNCVTIRVTEPSERVQQIYSLVHRHTGIQCLLLVVVVDIQGKPCVSCKALNSKSMARIWDIRKGSFKTVLVFIDYSRN